MYPSIHWVGRYASQHALGKGVCVSQHALGGGVCLPGGCLPGRVSARGGVCLGGGAPPGPEADTTPTTPDTTGNGQQAGGTHPTEVHSCLLFSLQCTL